MVRAVAVSFLLLIGAGCSEGGSRPVPEEGAGGGGAAPDDELQVPFVVDDHFSPSGPMGDAITGLESRPNRCLRRPEGAQGSCYALLLHPGSEGWGGLYFLASPNSWGDKPGIVVAKGAVRVRFRAAASIITPVKFLAGGLVGDAPYAETFAVEREVELTTELREFSLSLATADYERGVQGAFGFTMTLPADVTLYLDDIRWE